MVIPLTKAGDQVLKALTLTNKIGQQLHQILDGRESMESKLQTMEGALSQIPNMEKSVTKIQVSIVSFHEKVKKMDETIPALDAGCRHRGREKEILGKIKVLQDEIFYQVVHSAENASDVVYVLSVN